jgi:hypothetical protein
VSGDFREPRSEEKTASGPKAEVRDFSLTGREPIEGKPGSQKTVVWAKQYELKRRTRPGIRRGLNTL